MIIKRYVSSWTPKKYALAPGEACVDPVPDPLTQLNPDPKHWTVPHFSNKIYCGLLVPLGLARFIFSDAAPEKVSDLENLCKNAKMLCCRSGMFIPYPGSDFFPSRIRTVSIPDLESASKNLSILTPKKPKKWFLSSRKYDPGCSSRIRMLTFYPSKIPDPGVKKAPDPGSGSATLQKYNRITW